MTKSTQVLDSLAGSFTSPMLPAALGADDTNTVFGSVLLNSEVDPVEEQLRSMHWLVLPDRANFVLATLLSRQDDDTPTWEPTSAWTIALGPDMVVTVGTSVCKPAPHTYDWQQGEFVAVVNLNQDQAFAAWTMAENGPTPYAELATLDCERFIP